MRPAGRPAALEECVYAFFREMDFSANRAELFTHFLDQAFGRVAHDCALRSMKHL